MATDSPTWPQRAIGTFGGIVGLIVFFGSWAYCIATYGFLLGVGLGWLPSAITATIVAAVVVAIIYALFYTIRIIFRVLTMPIRIPTIVNHEARERARRRAMGYDK